MYGTQTAIIGTCSLPVLFENDVKMYGTQATSVYSDRLDMFENDVKMYGTQAIVQNLIC